MFSVYDLCIIFVTIHMDLYRHRGKKMRIDYHLVSEKLKDKIVKCEMHGQGIELEGFYGSDHCPVTLELAETTVDAS
ncbi:putative DNA-(apurinic or apyrimidinic site) lyase [Helianthus annuus]|nr:putative DNA-(apurinic or apyrimidinic site) lyase [Helianthus annuus]